MANVVDTSSASPPSAEQLLRHAKESVALLQQLVAQAERGAPIDFARARVMVSETMQRLQQHLLPQPVTTAGAATTTAAAMAASTLPQQQSPSLLLFGGEASAQLGNVHARNNVTARLAAAPTAVATTELQRRRAQQVLTELEYMDAMLQRHARTAQQRQHYAAQLHELRGGADGSSSNSDNNSGPRVEYAALDAYERERRSLQYTRRRVQQMQTESREVLRALQDQGTRLGGVAGKLTHMFEAIDLSNMTVTQILRRNKVDAWLVYCGIAALLFLLWWMLW